MNEIETKQDEEETLALWEVFQGVIAMFIGVQSEKIVSDSLNMAKPTNSSLSE